MEEKVQIDHEWRILIQKAKHLGLTKEEVRRFIYEAGNTQDTYVKQQAEK